MALVTMFAGPGIGAVVTMWGEFVPDENGVVAVPEGAVPTMITHGYTKTKSNAPAVLGTKPKNLAEMQKAPAPDPLTSVSLDERVAKADYFALKEYCEANEVGIPKRASTDKLRELVLAHLKSERKAL